MLDMKNIMKSRSFRNVDSSDASSQNSTQFDHEDHLLYTTKCTNLFILV